LIDHPAAARAAKLVAYVLAVAGGVCVLWPLLTTAVRERRRFAQITHRAAQVLSQFVKSLERTVVAAGFWPLSAAMNRLRMLATRGIPIATPRAAGLFRIVFGVVVVAIAAAEPAHRRVIDGFDLSKAEGVYGVVVRTLASSPTTIQGVDVALLVFGALFVAGVATRVSYAIFVAAFVLWTCLLTVDRSLHVLSGLAIALIVLLPARWGDGLSIDAWLRRRRGTDLPSAASLVYGYPIWAPGFVLGLGFAAAALSKVKDGPAWILNGTVKYHFVTDLNQALVSWGPSLASLPGLAILLSAMAVAIEAAVPFASFTRDARLRLAAGLASWAMLSGFLIFQGIFWPAWWALTLGFLPLDAMLRVATSRSDADVWRPSVTAAPVWIPGVAALLISLQVVVSVWRIEARPLLTAYDMYSTTYRNDEEYARAVNLVYRVIAETSDGSRDISDCLLSDAEAARLVDMLRSTMSSRARQAAVLAIVPCVASVSGAHAIRLVGDRRLFDWQVGDMVWQRAVVTIGPLEFAAP
jgi:hypothetical protein